MLGVCWQVFITIKLTRLPPLTSWESLSERTFVIKSLYMLVHMSVLFFLLKHKQQTSIINFIEYLSCWDTDFGMKKSSAAGNSATFVSENC